MHDAEAASLAVLRATGAILACMAREQRKREEHRPHDTHGELDALAEMQRHAGEGMVAYVAEERQTEL